MAKDYKLNIFQALAALDQCQGGWLAQQSAEAQSGFSPFTALRFMVSVPDSEMAAYGLWLLNERVNVHLWKLHGQHPQLLFRLLASCGFGSAVKHSWLAGPSGRTTSNKAHALLAEMYPDCNDDEVATLLSLHSHASFKAFIDECGVQPDDAKAILEAFSEQGQTETTGQAKSKSKTTAKTKAAEAAKM